MPHMTGSSESSKPAQQQQQEQLPFTNDDVDEGDFRESSGSVRDRTLPQLIRTRSPGTSSQLSSSYTQRMPSRSFVHYASSGSLETPQYASSGVRQRTQELAAYHLSEPNSLPLYESNLMPRGRFGAPADESEYSGNRDSLESFRSEVIQEESESESRGDSSSTARPSLGSEGSISSRGRRGRQRADSERMGAYSEDGRYPIPDVVVEDTEPDANTSLLPKARLSKPQDKRQYGTVGDVEDYPSTRLRRGSGFWWSVARAKDHAWDTFHYVTHPKQWSMKDVKHSAGATGKMISAVFLGLLLNILDGLSYGLILFPLGTAIFADTATDGLGIFYVSCIVSQLVYSWGGSKFSGGVGSEMIEVVPFFHKMAFAIIAHMNVTDDTTEETAAAVKATVITAYCMSSVVTGILFGLLGIFKLGSLVSFFPRSLLEGCIGGVGFFLFVTGIEVSARLDGNLEYNMATLRQLFGGYTPALWITPLALAISYMTLKRYYTSATLLPLFIITTWLIFYIVTWAVPSLSMETLRDSGWVFDMPASGVPFWHFYTLFNFNIVNWGAIGKCIPTMFALSFFGIIHVPINVPALAQAVQEDHVDVNRELIAHGISNTLSGFVGSIQNYLVYVNSDLFYKHGGDNRVAGTLLALATFGIWAVGPWVIGYVPIMVVGCLIFYMGIDLLETALYATWGSISKLEYFMILVIVLVMGVYDFVVGIVVGIVLVCLVYVVKTSQTPAIRRVFAGTIATSTVRRPPLERDFLAVARRQINIIKLNGYLFFGSIVAVENKVRELVDEELFSQQPIRYVVIDFQHVLGLDFTASGTFKRMNRLLAARQIEMMLSGVTLSDQIGRDLQRSGLLDQRDASAPAPKVFEDLNTALEDAENGLLEALKEQRRNMQKEAQPVTISPPKTSNEPMSFDAAAFQSPRRGLLQEAANQTLNQHASTAVNGDDAVVAFKWRHFAQPVRLMLQTFQGLSEKNEDFWHQAAPYFERRVYVMGTILYHRGDRPDGFYLLEQGSLRTEYEFEQGEYREIIMAGTTCGELPFFSREKRSSTVVAETDCVAWLLTQEKYEQLEKQNPDIALELHKIGHKLTHERMNAYVSYTLTTAG